MADGKHPVACRCGSLTYRKDGLCARCGRMAMFDPEKLSEEELMECARELARRHHAREKALKKIGMLSGAA